MTRKPASQVWNRGPRDADRQRLAGYTRQRESRKRDAIDMKRVLELLEESSEPKCASSLWNLLSEQGHHISLHRLREILRHLVLSRRVVAIRNAVAGRRTVLFHLVRSA